jgi:hypothetical protein
MVRRWVWENEKENIPKIRYLPNDLEKPTKKGHQGIWISLAD